MDYGEAVLRIIGAIVALALVLFLAWVVTRWLAKRVPGIATGQNRLIQVLDRVNISRTSGLVLLRVDTKVLLVGFSEHNTRTLAEFEDPEENIRRLEDAQTPSFSDALKNAAGQFGFGGKKNKPNGGEDE